MLNNSETKELIWLEEEEFKNFNLGVLIGSVKFWAVQYLKHKGRIIVYRQARNEFNNKYGIVPGYKASEPYKTKYGVSAIEVIPISSEEEREEIRRIISLKLEGPINLW